MGYRYWPTSRSVYGRAWDIYHDRAAGYGMSTVFMDSPRGIEIIWAFRPISSVRFCGSLDDPENFAGEGIWSERSLLAFEYGTNNRTNDIPTWA